MKNTKKDIVAAKISFLKACLENLDGYLPDTWACIMKELDNQECIMKKIEIEEYYKWIDDSV